MRSLFLWHGDCRCGKAIEDWLHLRGTLVGHFGWLRTPARARAGRVPFWGLVAVTATGTLAMHILAPVLPLAAADLGISRSTIQLAVTLYLLGIAAGQLLYGPVSDKFGRRPTLLAALCLYLAASAVAGWAGGIATLLVARVVQAVGGCGGLVLGRAIVRDSAVAGRAASRMALLTMVQSLAPGIGPAVGGFIGAWFGWRLIFVALVVVGIVTLVGVWLVLPETAASCGRAGSGRMLGSYLSLLRSRSFCGYMLGGAFTGTSLYAYLAASPFIFTQMLQRPATEVGLSGSGERRAGRQLSVEPVGVAGGPGPAVASDERHSGATTPYSRSLPCGLAQVAPAPVVAFAHPRLHRTLYNSPDLPLLVPLQFRCNSAVPGAGNSGPNF